MILSHHKLPSLSWGVISACALLLSPACFAQGEPAQEEAKEKEAAKESDEKPKAEPKAEPKARIYLSNGDRLTGMPLGIDADGNLAFKADCLANIAPFTKSEILTLEFDQWEEEPQSNTLARVTIRNRHAEKHTMDTLTGTLAELTPDSIKLDTWYAGIITLDRKMVQDINIISNQAGNYYGPNNIKEWTRPEGKESWSYKSGVLYSNTASSIGKDIGMKSKSHVSFFADWDSSMRFKLRLYNSDVSETSPDAYHEISFQSSYAYLRTRGNAGNGVRVGRGNAWKRLNSRPTDTKARFDIYMDKETSSFAVYINGKLSCNLQGQNQAPKDLGTGISFVAESRYKIQISSITVLPWDGISLPNTQTKEQDGDGEQENEEAPHKVILVNGDEVPGTVGTVKDGKTLFIETEFTPIEIPIDRIKSLSISSSNDEPKMYADDIRAYFHRGGHVTLRLASFKDGKVSGFSQVFGDATFELKAFSRIDFDIYNQEANKERAKQ